MIIQNVIKSNESPINMNILNAHEEKLPNYNNLIAYSVYPRIPIYYHHEMKTSRYYNNIITEKSAVPMNQRMIETKLSESPTIPIINTMKTKTATTKPIKITQQKVRMKPQQKLPQRSHQKPRHGPQPRPQLKPQQRPQPKPQKKPQQKPKLKSKLKEILKLKMKQLKPKLKKQLKEKLKKRLKQKLNKDLKPLIQQQLKQQLKL